MQDLQVTLILLTDSMLLLFLINHGGIGTVKMVNLIGYGVVIMKMITMYIILVILE
nr:MAG TPA: hypothetical protein [Caudoviricetes sp.]